MEGDALLSCDVVIVGAGPAGLTLAERLGVDHDVILLERGGLSPNSFQGAHKVDAPDGYTYDLALSRGTGVGGSSGRWDLEPGWQARPLDPMDFETRDWLPKSGWPIGLADLSSSYEEAHKICGLKSLDYEALPGGQADSVTETLTGVSDGFVFSRMQHTDRDIFVRKTGFLGSSDSIRVIYNSAVTDIVPDRENGAVDILTVRSTKSKEFKVKAKIFVLAAGGIENVGILLRSPLSEDNPNIGKFFMEHPHVNVGKLVFHDDATAAAFRGFSPSAYSLDADAPDAKVPATKLVFRTTREFCERHGIGNCLILGHNGKERVYSRVLKGWRELRRLRTRGIRAPDGVERKLFFNFLKEVPALLKIQSLRPSTLQQTRSCLFLVAEAEQVPNEASKVYLHSEKDEFGLEKATLSWSITPQDIQTIRAPVAHLAKTFAARGIGTVYDVFGEKDPAPQIAGGSHHIGTTRMAENARDGVVDKDLRFHGLANLYVAGSSVFPTSGASNPTLTVIALSVRLAKTINKVLSQPEATVSGDRATGTG